MHRVSRQDNYSRYVSLQSLRWRSGSFGTVHFGDRGCICSEFEPRVSQKEKLVECGVEYIHRHVSWLNARGKSTWDGMGPISQIASGLFQLGCNLAHIEECTERVGDSVDKFCLPDCSVTYDLSLAKFRLAEVRKCNIVKLESLSKTRVVAFRSERGTISPGCAEFVFPTVAIPGGGWARKFGGPDDYPGGPRLVQQFIGCLSSFEQRRVRHRVAVISLQIAYHLAGVDTWGGTLQVDRRHMPPYTTDEDCRILSRFLCYLREQAQAAMEGSYAKIDAVLEASREDNFCSDGSVRAGLSMVEYASLLIALSCVSAEVGLRYATDERWRLLLKKERDASRDVFNGPVASSFRVNMLACDGCDGYRIPSIVRETIECLQYREGYGHVWRFSASDNVRSLLSSAVGSESHLSMFYHTL